ncbi:MAG: hypothetical protein J4F41_02890 [Alphaproteobacteria bacterium]|nr:hypothetical protein [Alphaproteobacteria bacterium]
MAASAQTIIDQIRHDVGAAMLSRLNSHGFSEITPDHLAEDTSHDVAVIRRIFPDLSAAVDQGLKDIDDAVSAGLQDDFAEDAEATTRERILEGLIVRFEAYVPFKHAIRNLNKAAAMNPPLALMMVGRLSGASQALLEISGLDTSGLKGLMRVKGLAAVALSVQRDWLADDSADLSVTIRALDKRLGQAESLAETLNIISRDHDASDHATTKDDGREDQ